MIEQTRPLNERLQRYWNDRARTFDWIRRAPDGFDAEGAWREIVSMLLTPSSGQRPVRRVADVGTGSGMIAVLAASLGYEVIAIDFAPAMVERAKQSLAPWPDAQVRQGDACALPLQHGEVDAIIGRNVLWTLPSPEDALKHWSGLLQPGGRIGIIDGTHHGDFRRFPALYKHLSKAFGHGGHPDPVADNNPNKEVPLATLDNPQQVAELFRRVDLAEILVRDHHEVDRRLRASWSWLNRVTYKPRTFSISARVR
ncbi:class I SAM-dependent methyltransferase [Pelagibacterium luteolum]|uniref:class I SAM-dependent methyltransferase n=1 Tax=Pelagibacterium luteolum TaxID=440168 RepID=UPI00115FEDD1|nr:class I SAM-dependent methyltransferase [Pelagibacterium luteolum]